ncbi:MAG TPA: hypothetical protein VNF72_15470 [Myxococcota bacterium]|nr:hypothetical protein [Myxococcota bacterium]
MRAAAPELGAAALAALIERGDHWRSGAVPGAGDPHHEWSHFVVFAPGVDLLINFSRFAASSERPCSQLTLLARTADGRWRGDVERHPESDVRMPGGRVEADVGPSQLRFRNGVYELRAVLRDREIEARLRLRPQSRPALTSSVSLRPGFAMWFAVPRLEAEGEVRIGSRRIAFRGAPAYHDRDWGRFHWGGDHAWEWAVALPADLACPWSLVVQQISDRARHHFLSKGMLVWRNGLYWRTLHHRALEIAASGLRPAAGALRVPRIMDLVSPGRAADVPERIDVVAHEGDDRVEGEIRVQDLVQICVPNDRDLGTTVISEARAQACFEGRVRGERLQLEGPAILELNRAEA